MTTPRLNNKHQSWSFSFKAKKLPKPVTAHNSQSYFSLPKEFFSQLIKLETEFQNKSYTLETLNQLTQYYARAVEHYDNFKDEISSYFMYKIQDILATQKSLRMLTNHNKSFEDKENIIPGSCHSSAKKDTSFRDGILNSARSCQKEDIIEESSEDDEEKERNELERKRLAVKPNTDNKPSISTLRNQKQRFVHLFYKIENEIGNEKENMHTTLEKFASVKEKNDDFIKNEIDQQKLKLRQRLDQRRQQSYMSQTVNTQSFISTRKTPLPIYTNYDRKEQNGATLEYMLNALDEGDELDYRKFISKPESVMGEFTSANISIHEGYDYKSPTESNPNNISISKDIMDNELNSKTESAKEKVTEAETAETNKVKEGVGNNGNSSADTEKTSTENDKEDSVGEKAQKE